MNTLGLSILATLALWTFFGPRRHALLAVFCGVLFLTQGQSIQVVGVDLYAMRLLLLTAFLRTVVRQELQEVRASGLDTTLVITYGYTAVVCLLNGNEPPMTQIGTLTDVLLAYFTFRGLLDSEETIRWCLKIFSLVLVFYAAIVTVEMLTEHNPFSAMGGVPEKWEYRGGRLRCMGSFRHPSLLGTLGASFFPLYVWLALIPGERFWGYLGMASCLGIVYLSNSGGPVLALSVGVVSWLFWVLRRRMLAVRVAAVAGIALLALAMKAPIWYLPAKVSAIIGGDGWHRSYLMEVAFSHWREWWFAGMHVLDTKDWFPYVVVTGGADLINYYLDFGITGGGVALLLFIRLLVHVYRCLGSALETVRDPQETADPRELLLWALGAVLTTHIFNWFGIVYFDQSYVLWMFHLAAITFLSSYYIEQQDRQSLPGNRERPLAVMNDGRRLVNHRARRVRH